MARAASASHRRRAPRNITFQRTRLSACSSEADAWKAGVDAYSRTPGAFTAKGNHLIRLAENVRLIRVFYNGKESEFRRPETLHDTETVTIDTEMDLRISNEPTRLATYMVKLEFTAAAKPAERTLFSRS